MLTAGVDGFLAGAADAGLPAPVPLAVTILTSDDGAPDAHPAQARAGSPWRAGARGSCARRTTSTRRSSYGPRLTAVVPGIRPAGTPAHDQARSSTPERALASGADVLVVGRAVTHAEDPRAAAAASLAAVVARRDFLDARVRPMPQPPVLTPEQREQALAKAAEARRARPSSRRSSRWGR